MDPRQLKKMMKKMGINVTEMKADRVIIESGDRRYIFNEPEISIMEVKGQKTYQITGEPKVEIAINEEDVELVAMKTGKSIEEARDALKKANGDIAEAILSLSS